MSQRQSSWHVHLIVFHPSFYTFQTNYIQHLSISSSSHQRLSISYPGNRQRLTSTDKQTKKLPFAKQESKWNIEQNE